MLKGKTDSGFEFEIADKDVNNYELLESLAEVDDNPMLLPKVVKLLLGTKQSDALKDHVRTEDGTVPMDAIGIEITQIFNSGQIKNS